jgi:hypothetical protein
MTPVSTLGTPLAESGTVAVDTGAPVIAVKATPIACLPLLDGWR